MTLFGYVEVGCHFGDLRERVITSRPFSTWVDDILFGLGWVGFGGEGGAKDFHG
jgi:hypothetical protein